MNYLPNNSPGVRVVTVFYYPKTKTHIDADEVVIAWAFDDGVILPVTARGIVVPGETRPEGVSLSLSVLHDVGGVLSAPGGYLWVTRKGFVDFALEKLAGQRVRFLTGAKA